MPDVTFVGSGALGHGESGQYDSALLLASDDRQFVVRVPNNQQAETDQSRELLVLHSMTAGIRSRLPFSIPSSFGQAPTDATRAVVYDYLPGYQVDAAHIPAGDGLATSIGAAIAAIHSLPGSFVSEAGLPVQSASESRTEAVSIIERAAATKLLPSAVRKRWLDAAKNDSLWRFQPAVINGAISSESFLVTNHDVGPVVSGMLGWGSLRLADPARDLHWISATGDAADSVLASYTSTCSRHPDAMINQRAMLYAELELARWLLHGRDTHDQGVVDDAVAMLDGLVDHVLDNTMAPIMPETGPILTVSDVETMLDDTPATPERASGISMETDSFDRSEFEKAFGAELGDEAEPEADDIQDDAPADHDSLETGPVDLVELAESNAHDESTDDSQRERSSSSE